MTYNSHGIEVALVAVVLLENDLGSHVARSTWSLVGVLSLVHLCNSKVGDLDVPIWVKNQVFRLDVSMDDVVLVNVLESNSKTSYNEPGLLLGKTDSFSYVVPQVATSHQVADQVNVFNVLESVHHVHNEGVAQLGQELSLGHHRVEWSTAHDPSLLHLFHCIVLLVFLVLHLPDFAKATTADAVQELKLFDRHQVNWFDCFGDHFRCLQTLAIAHLNSK